MDGRDMDHLRSVNFFDHFVNSPTVSLPFLVLTDPKLGRSWREIVEEVVSKDIAARKQAAYVAVLHEQQQSQEEVGHKSHMVQHERQVAILKLNRVRRPASPGDDESLASATSSRLP